MDLFEQRHRWASLLIDMEQANQRAGYGEPGLWVQRGVEDNRAAWRLTTSPQVNYDLRTVLANEVVLDIGDSGDWERCRRTSHLAWIVLNRWRVPYLAALSRNKGTHTHVFLGGGSFAPSARRMFAEDLLNAMDALDTYKPAKDGGPAERLDVDPKLLWPAPGSRMVWDFGCGIKLYKKTLWFVGPGFRALPTRRNEAYKQAGVVVPHAVPLAEDPPGARHAAIAEMLGKMCPQGTFCYPGPESDLGLDGTCDHCPASM